MPITDRSGPDLGRCFKAAAFCTREFAVLGNSEVWKITERVKMLRAFPNRPHRIIGECQFRDRTCASDYLCKKNAIRREAEKCTDRTFTTSRTILHVAAVGSDRKSIAA